MDSYSLDFLSSTNQLKNKYSEYIKGSNINKEMIRIQFQKRKRRERERGYLATLIYLMEGAKVLLLVFVLYNPDT